MIRKKIVHNNIIKRLGESCSPLEIKQDQSINRLEVPTPDQVQNPIDLIISRGKLASFTTPRRPNLNVMLLLIFSANTVLQINKNGNDLISKRMQIIGKALRNINSEGISHAIF